MEDDRIELSEQIIFTRWIARIYWLEQKLWVVIPGETDFSLEGEEASKVWRLFSKQVGWREKDLTD